MLEVLKYYLIIYLYIGWSQEEGAPPAPNTKLSITRSFFELQSPDFAWKFVWTVQTNTRNTRKNKNTKNAKNIKNIKNTKKNLRRQLLIHKKRKQSKKIKNAKTQKEKNMQKEQQNKKNVLPRQLLVLRTC